jgi:hypothetical protein
MRLTDATETRGWGSCSLAGLMTSPPIILYTILNSYIVFIEVPLVILWCFEQKLYFYHELVYNPFFVNWILLQEHTITVSLGYSNAGDPE